MKNVLTTLIAAGLATAGLGLAVAAGPAAATAAPPECGVGQLAAKFTAGSPGAGNRYATLTLTNRSRSTCTTGGYVGLGLESAQGRELVTHVVRTDAAAIKLIELTPGAKVTSQLHWGAVEGTGDRSGGPCFVAPRRILVTPPDSRVSLDLRWTQGVVCEAGRIDITPLTASR